MQVTRGKVRFYHLFNDINNMKRNNTKFVFIHKINSYLLTIQCKFKVNRHKEDIWYGSQWFSITDNFATSMIANKEYLIKKYRFTSCSDEIFMQTFYANKYSKNINESNYVNKRLIDWNRGNPYCFNKKDYHQLINSNCLFARKFDENCDKNIIDMIYKKISGEVYEG